MKIVTWGGHDINDELNYKATFSDNAYSMADIAPVLVKRSGRFPILGAVERPDRQLDIDIVILKTATRDTLAAQLMTWFDPDDATPQQLIIEDDAGGNPRYVYAICQALDNAGSLRRRAYHATLVISGDVLWRYSTAETDTWSITATGQTKVLDNNGEAAAYPILQISPTSAKAGGFLYRRFISLRWRTTEAATMYPVDIVNNGLDTATLVGAGKMQADGDDVRVLVDGVEVSRWLQDMDNATTQVWVSLDFQPKMEFTISEDCASAGAITTLDFDGDVWGSIRMQGIFFIGNEAFTYTGLTRKSRYISTFTGVSRAAHGTTADGHTTGDTGWWCQHEIYLVYGNAALGTPAFLETGKPVFSLASTNTSWVYANFGVTGERMAGAWSFVGGRGLGYTANQHTWATTWAELGIATEGVGVMWGYWYLTNPCYITNANFSNGQKWVESFLGTFSLAPPWYDLDATIDAYYLGPAGYNWFLQDSIAAPSAEAGWEAWSDNQALTALSTGVRLSVVLDAYDPRVQVNVYLEAADCTLTLNSSYTPVVAIGAETGGYTLAARISNTTTGQIIDLDFVMPTNQELEVDTDAKTLTYLADGSNQFQALTMVDGPRRDWLKLQPGNNTIQYDETGAAGVTIEFEWEERLYH